MNYVELYCGDYMRDTGELTLAEHGAYLKLLLTYYSTERPLPADLAALCRICAAMTPPERQAVTKVAELYFPVMTDGLRHKSRCDEEIEKAQRRIEAAKANGKHGGRPRKETKQKPTGFHSGSISETQSGEALHAPRASSISEIPKHTEVPITSSSTDSAPADAVGSFEGHNPADQAAATAKGRALVDAAITIRGAGCKDVQASNPFLVQALADGITVAELADAARATGKPIKYLCTMVRGQKAEAAAFAGPLPPPIASTRNPNGPSARKTRDEEKAQEREALALQAAQFKELGYG